MDFFNSFFQNVKDKLTNPFFGTLGFILILHHWEFWYTLFNFDADCSRVEKLAILKLMVAKDFAVRNLLEDIFLTVVFVLAGYLVVFGTRALSLSFDHKLMTWLTKKVVSKNVVLLETHREVVQERDRYSEQYEEQRQRVRNFSANLDEQTRQIQEKDKLILTEGAKVNELNISNAKVTTELNREKQKNESLQNANDEKETQVDRIENEYNKSVVYMGELEKELYEFKTIFFDQDKRYGWNSPDKFPLEILNKVHELRDSNEWSHFLKLYNAMQNGGSFSENELLKFKESGLISLTSDPKLTILGRIIGFYSNIFDDNISM
ncbi:hypothetical protein [Pedobacter paludis]|uniref:Uncharacterized protein n=1 Tax=Pedobacter paludis TaxID=2203212 RepID=A0A317F8F9_9SPHI|nr:hypothetical protein [Pedobacter paludis]PWS33866.1 hypothetical protein DF947_04455 [Pedobacter paludis]